MYSLAVEAFLIREQNFWEWLARDPALMESRLTRFFECPSTLDLVREMMQEDAAVNAVGTGAIAGCGVGPQGEPGVKLPRKKKRVDEAKWVCPECDDRGWVLEKYYDDSVWMVCMTCHNRYNKKSPAYGDVDEDAKWCDDGNGTCPACGLGAHFADDPLCDGVIKEETFAGAEVFQLNTDAFLKSRFGKNRYHRYSRYVGEGPDGEAVRQYGRKNTKKEIIIKDGTTGAMVYLRRNNPTK